jgi:hypothetical protein
MPMDHDALPRLELIDNSQLVYIPIVLPRCRVTINCRPIVLSQFPQIVAQLDRDVDSCLRVLPRSVHALIRRTQLWVNGVEPYQYGSVDNPITVHHCTTHHFKAWLTWAHDRLDKALGIEIYNCVDYACRMQYHYNAGGGLLLHEYCHLIHQLVLTNGLDNPDVPLAYQSAQQSGLYEHVLRRDWITWPSEGEIVRDERRDMAYAMVDYKEFFAEMSVAYLAKGYDDLSTNSFLRLVDCSPPFMEPTIVQQLLEAPRTDQPRYEIHPHFYTLVTSSCDPSQRKSESISCFSNGCPDQATRSSMPSGTGSSTLADHISRCAHLRRNRFENLGRWWGRLVDHLSGHDVPQHCNKFYPFTSGQLLYYDPATYQNIHNLWDEIGRWRDDANDTERLYKGCTQETGITKSENDCFGNGDKMQCWIPPWIRVTKQPSFVSTEEEDYDDQDPLDEVEYCDTVSL